MSLVSLASTRLTLLAIASLAIGVAWFHATDGASRAWVAGPLLLLTLNLGAAVLCNASFRAELPLLAFHIALFAIVALAAAGQLTFLKGRLELAEGEVFAGELAHVTSGPLHAGSLAGVRFVNDGFSIRYAPGLKRAETHNPVRVFDGAGGVAGRVIADNDPLQVDGYRFYPSFNKGFSLVFRWHPPRGAPERGTVNLPAYPLHEYRQALEWRLPGGGPAVWTMLHFDRPPLDEARETWFGKPESHHVVLRAGDARWELRPGAQVSLASGVLAYEGLSTWMGYNVFYDWTLPWLLAACVTAVASLAWHFARKFARQPWDA